MNMVKLKAITKGQLMILCLVLLLAVIWIPSLPFEKAYALCSGSGCQGYNPNSLGCDADAQMGSVRNLFNGSKAQNRYSNACNAEWERTVQGTFTEYASGTIRWNPSAFAPYYHVYSPDPIAPGQKVYTLMAGPKQTTKSCGETHTQSLPLISPPPQTDTNCINS